MLGFLRVPLERGIEFGWSIRFWWTGYRKMRITIQRKSSTVDGIFGVLTLDWNPFTCVTLENRDKAIPAGIYEVDFSYSPHFNRIMPLILVPGREGVRYHWANFPAQLEGCIAVGTAVDGDSIDQSLIPFNRLYALMGQQHGITTEILDIPS